MEEDDDTNNAIRKLNDDAIRRIVAEQAITDLSSIVKELVDNAIDAESTTIKIRLFGHGLEIIEVSDDGFGVPLHSRDQLATRYATSKIRSFEDIYSGTGLSMGFRGEALFSMACLSSQLVVATRTESEDVAQKMFFQRDGSLDKSSVTAVHRKIGTTVAVLKPFAHLPARRADMARRIRAERSKLFRLVESYAIFNVGVAINLIDIVSGRENVALATSSTSSTLAENVSAVMGHKFLSTLAPIDVKLGDVVGPNKDDNMHDWGIRGLLSRNPQADPPSRGITCFCINGRVVQLPKLAALLRKIWTGFAGRKKKESAILSLTLPNCSFDINLSPDKQQILLNNEDVILDVFSSALTDFYSSQVNGKFPAKRLEQPGTEEIVEKERQKHKRRFAFVHDLSKAKLQHDLEDRESTKRQKIECDDITSFQKDQGGINLWGKNENKECPLGNTMGSDRREKELTNGLVANEEKVDMNEHRKEKPGETNVGRKQLKCSRSGEKQNSENYNPPASLAGKSDDSSDILLKSEHTQSSDDSRGTHPGYWCDKNQEVDSDTTRCRAIRRNARPTDYERQQWTEIQSKFRADQSRVDIEGACTHANVTSTKTLCSNSSFNDSLETKSKGRPCQKRFEKACSPAILVPTTKKPQKSNVNTSEEHLSGMMPDSNMPSTRGGNGEIDAASREPSTEGPKSLLHTIKTNSGDGKAKRGKSFANINEPNSARPEGRSSTSLHWASFIDMDRICTKARAERVVLQKQGKDSLYGPVDEVLGTEEDKNIVCKRDRSQSIQADVLNLSKTKFRGGMKVLGQFNLGFILCLCNENNVWIFDQHACDEKYNFENLRRETKMHEQKLLKPMVLELTSSEEACILDHLDVFAANGFRFEFRPKAPIRRRLLLTALPHSGAQEGRKAVQFGQEDVKVLCAMLSEGASYDAGDGGTGTDGSGKFGNNAVRYASMASTQQDQPSNIISRLPKAISMFASRSCRSSVMIGTSLSGAQMKQIVSRLADVEFPWTCPHGRPTVRHVGNVSTIMFADVLRDQGKHEEAMALHQQGISTKQGN